MIAIGIDVSKSKSTVAILNGDGSIRAKPFDVRHTADELQALVKCVKSTGETPTILMEPTSHYHYPILKAFLAANLPVCLINPYQMKKYGDTALRKAKTDKRDSLKIAQYALEKSHSLVPYTPAEQKYEDLRFLSRQYGQRMAALTVAKVQLISLLDETMPGISNILPLKSRDPDNCVLLCFIKRFKSFDMIRKMGKTRFMDSYQVLVRKTTDTSHIPTLRVMIPNVVSLIPRLLPPSKIMFHQSVNPLRHCGIFSVIHRIVWFDVQNGSTINRI